MPRSNKLQVVFVGNAARLAGMHAAGGGNDHHFLATAQAFRAGFGVTEGLAGNGDAVDPGLELGRHGEVVHRRGDHDGVGGDEFGQGRSAQFGFVLLCGVAQFSGVPAATRVVDEKWLMASAARSR
jgi:hypothetical protein